MPAERIICSVDICDKLARGRGWCDMHYQRWRKHGDPVAGATHKGALLAFMENTALTYTRNDCLIWPFSMSATGQGLNPDELQR